MNLIARWKRLKRRLLGCLLLLLLLVGAGCAGLIYLVSTAAAAVPTAAGPPLEVMLLIDNSNSMFEKNGPGADPELLRIQAARLFINYLGVDHSGVTHRLGVISFGGEAVLLAPLTPLADDRRRAELVNLIDNPQRLRWTNPQAALELAADQFDAAPAQRAVILLTDGKPEWNNTPTLTQTTRSIAGLRTIANRLAARQIPLFVILLQNSATDTDPEIEQLYVPLWQEFAQQTTPGNFYLARSGDALLDIYHEIVVKLTGRATAGRVMQTTLQTAVISHPLTVEPNLAQVTFVVHKSDPAVQVALFQPNGQLVQAALPGVQYAGQPGRSREEIWAISQPPAGAWTVSLSGQGQVTLWKDYEPAPTSTPSPTATNTNTPFPSPSPTASPTSTLPPTSIATPSPTATPPPTDTPVPLPTVTPIPSATAPPPQVSTLPPPSAPLTRLKMLVWPMLLVAAGGTGWLLLTQRLNARAPLSGSLRLLSGSGLADDSLPRRIDLDSLGAHTYTLGALPHADLYLPAGLAGQAVRLTGQASLDDRPQVTLEKLSPQADAPVLVNGTPVSRTWSLQDGDVITLGEYRFKYENLRQRRVTLTPAARRSLR